MSLTAKQKIEAEEMKYHRYCEIDSKCEACGVVMPYSYAQLSHIVPQTKAYVKKYGPEIIHHPMNWKLTCCLACNASVQINPATRPVEAEAHINAIRAELGIIEK